MIQQYFLKQFVFFSKPVKEIYGYLTITLKIKKIIASVCDVINSNKAFHQLVKS